MNNETKDVFKHLFRINLIVTVGLLLLAIIGIKDIVRTTKTTKALSEVAQRVGVDFPTQTNNVLWVWEVVKPK
jgi:hypothetical protein